MQYHKIRMASLPSLGRRMRHAYGAGFHSLHRSSWILAGGALINAMGGVVSGFLALYLTQRFQITLTEASPVLVAGGAGMVLGSFIGGFVCDRWPPKWILAASLAVPAGFYAAMPLIDDLAVLAGMGFSALFFAGAYRPAYQVAIIAYSGGATPLAQGYALYRVAINIGVAAGSLIGAGLLEWDARWLFWLNAGSGIVVTVWLGVLLHPVGRDGLGTDRSGAAALQPSPPTHEHATPEAPMVQTAQGPGSPWRDTVFWLLCFFALIQDIMFFQINNSYSIYLVEVMALPATVYGALMAINCLIIVLFEVPLVHATRNRNPVILAALGMASVGMGFGVLAFADGMAMALVSCLLITLGEMLFFPGAVRLIGLRAPAARIGAYLGIYQTVGASARAAAPGIGGYLYGIDQGISLWLGCLFMGPASALAMVGLDHILRRRQKAVL